MVQPSARLSTQVLIEIISKFQFFTRKGLPNVKTKDELFSSITGLDSSAHTTAMLERIHDKGPSMVSATTSNRDDEDTPEIFKPLAYPFDVAWQKTQEEKMKLCPSSDEEGATQILPLAAN